MLMTGATNTTASLAAKADANALDVLSSTVEDKLDSSEVSMLLSGYFTISQMNAATAAQASTTFATAIKSSQ